MFCFYGGHDTVTGCACYMTSTLANVMTNIISADNCLRYRFITQYSIASAKCLILTVLLTHEASDRDGHVKWAVSGRLNYLFVLDGSTKVFEILIDVLTDIICRTFFR